MLHVDSFLTLVLSTVTALSEPVTDPMQCAYVCASPRYILRTCYCHRQTNIRASLYPLSPGHTGFATARFDRARRESWGNGRESVRLVVEVVGNR